MGAIAAGLRRSWWGAPTALGLGLFVWEAGFELALDWRLSLVYVAALCAQVLVVALAVGAARTSARLRGRGLDRLLWWASLPVVVGFQVADAWGDFAQVDVMFLSGFLAFLLGLELTRRMPARLSAAVDRLFDRGVLSQSATDRAHSRMLLEQRARRWSLRGARTVAGALAAMWAVVLIQKPGEVRALWLWIVVFECLCAWVAGEQLGQMAAYGTLWRIHQRHGALLRVQPGHVDGAGGLKPLGDFYLVQSMVAAIPAVYLAVWWWAIPLIPRLEVYRTPYLGLLALAVGFEILAFLVPMSSIHRAMLACKVRLNQQADRIARILAELQLALVDAESAQQREEAKARIAHLTEQFHRIERAPVWPTSTAIRRRFSVNNVALLLPFLGYVFEGTQLWQNVQQL